jgi:predicted lipoprotein
MTATPGTSPSGRSLSPRLVGAVLLLALVLAMALSTKYVSASAPVPGEQQKFDAATFGKENYASEVKPAIEEDPVDVATLVPLIREDPEAAGEQYGTREGTSPFTYSVTLTGTAGKPASGLMPVTVGGVPKSTRIAVQVGPAVNGTALRDATGLISFNDFVNQVEYADAATALNTEMKADLLADLDPASLVGKTVTVVGATAPLNPDVITVTPVSIEVGR